MDRFLEAKEIVENYISRDRTIEIENIHIQLSKVGYSQERYLKELIEYNFNNSDYAVEYTSSEEAFKVTFCAVQNKAETVVLALPDKPFVYLGKDVFDKSYCDKNNIGYSEMKHAGGTIVSSSADLQIALITSEQDSCLYLKSKIDKWITDNFKDVTNHEITADHNDTLIDGYKVMGTSLYPVGGMYVMYFQISFEVDIDMIKSICTKEMKKIPKGLAEFGTTTRDDLIKELLVWLN